MGQRWQFIAAGRSQRRFQGLGPSDRRELGLEGCAHKGNRVIGVDVNPDKTKMLDCGQSPILEPQLDEIISNSNKTGRLRATTNSEAAVFDTEISFISVGTPSQRNGKLDLSGIDSGLVGVHSGRI